MKDITIICQENGFRKNVNLQTLNRTNPTFEDLEFYLAGKFNAMRSLVKAGVKFAYINQNSEMLNVNTSEPINNFSAKAGYTFYLQSGNVQNDNNNQIEASTNIENIAYNSVYDFYNSLSEIDLIFVEENLKKSLNKNTYDKAIILFTKKIINVKELRKAHNQEYLILAKWEKYK